MNKATKIENFALIIGAMKCGTSSLFSYLSQHPQISACNIKEPDFFAKEGQWKKGFQWYQNLWNYDPEIHQYALEASTNYTKLPKFNAAKKIATVKANFKFIYVMRNPLDRIESHYTHGQQEKWDSLQETMEKGISQYCIEVSKYAQQIDEYHKRFPAENIMLLHFEDLKKKPLWILQEVCQFLNLDVSANFNGIDKVHNSSQDMVVYNPIGFSIRELVKPVSRFVPEQPKQVFRSLFGEKLQRSKLSQEQRDFVLCKLQGDLRKLKLDYGVNVARWGIDI